MFNLRLDTLNTQKLFIKEMPAIYRPTARTLSQVNLLAEAGMLDSKKGVNGRFEKKGSVDWLIGWLIG